MLPSVAVAQVVKFACLSVFVVGLSCSGNSKNRRTQPTPATDEDKVLLKLADAKPGLTIELSEGKLREAAHQRNKVAAAQELSPERVEKLLSRVTETKAKASDQKQFALRKRSLPVPRTGETVAHSFPPKEGAQVRPKTSSELSIRRFSPEGPVPMAPHLSITFSDAMVAVTSQDDAAKTQPVKLSPQPAGRWRWLGTKTLLFDPEVRFPMSTRYEVEIPKGTRSAGGAILGQAKTFEFTTAALTLKQSYPEDSPQPLRPVAWLSFDQDIDREALLPSIEFSAKGKSIAARLASADEIAGDKGLASRVKRAEKDGATEGRWIAVVPAQELPAQTWISVTVKKGASSAEGPLKTTADQSFGFQTRGPLKVTDYECGWNGNCPPGAGFRIEFNNPLDEEAFSYESLKIDPEISGGRAFVHGDQIEIRGATKGRTSYSVTLPAQLRDRFGQTLGKEKTLRFKVGAPNPQVFAATGLTVADPSAKSPIFTVHSVAQKSLNVQVYKVGLNDWQAYLEFMRGNPRRPKPAPGKKVFDKKISVQGNLDEMSDTHIDLASALNSAGFGHAVVVVKPSKWPHRYKPEYKAWVQVTQIGLDAYADSEKLLVHVSELKNGQALADTRVELLGQNRSAVSGRDGLASMPLSSKDTVPDGGAMVVAARGEDQAFLPQSAYYYGGSRYGFMHPIQGDQARWFIFDDRGMYKPGETVHIKGWVRTFEERLGGDIVAFRGNSPIQYTAYDPRNNKIASGQTKLTALGGFDLEFKLPKTPNLGYARVELTAGDAGGETHGFQIQEFRRPEFEVSASASQGPHIVGKGADTSVSASYYAGGALPGAEVNWSVHSNPTNFTPPNQDKYTFGSWIPWWGGRGWGGEDSNANYQSFSGRTNAAGRHALHMDFVSVKPPRPMSVVAEASVMDVNRQSWASTTTLLVHPSELYVGLARDRYFVNKGEPIKLTGVICDQEGKISAGKNAVVRAYRMDWEYQNGEYKDVERDPQSCEVEMQGENFSCEFATKEGGQYKIVATVTDGEGRPNQTEITTWVSGGKRPPKRKVEQEQVTLIPDKKEYAAGEVAEILVSAPFEDAQGVLTLRRSGIVKSESFAIKGSSTTLKVAVEEGHVPNLYVQVDLVGAAMRVNDQGEELPEVPKRPAYATGSLNLSVPPTQRTLSLKVKPAEAKLSPGSETSVEVVVKDAKGKPVAGAEVTAFVVDESVLALSGYQTPDPIGGFYAHRGAGVGNYHQRQWLRLVDPEKQIAGAPPAPGGGPSAEGALDDYDSESLREDEEASMEAPALSGSASFGKKRKRSAKIGGRNRDQKKESDRREKDKADDSPIALRTNFSAIAAFAPKIATDASGKAVLTYKLPDNLTRYRVIAVASHGANHFGKGESNVTARMPLMVRPSPPRFLNFGDEFELPVVLQNQTDTAMKVGVAVRATNAALAKEGLEVLVPANDRVEIRFPTKTEMAGTARFQVIAASDAVSDANEFVLPVWTPATTEAFATYGEIDKGAIAQPVRVPPGVVTSFGEVSIGLSSTQMQALTDAFVYLVQYPYECAEQTSSRVMGIAALRDVLSAFKAEGLPGKDELEKVVERDLKRLQSLQNWDGGFAFWERGHESWPYVSIHVAHALSRAKDKGYAVSEGMLARSKEYLREIRDHIPSYYGPELRRFLEAYALYVRKRLGDVDVKGAKRVLGEIKLQEHKFETLGFLLPVLREDKKSQKLRDEIHRHLDNNVSETAGAANWNQGYGDNGHLVLHSNRRTDGILLEAIIEDKPQSDLIPKVVRGLLAHRKRGRWANTQDNVFVLQALDAYFRTYEKVTPNFVARLWLGPDFAGEQKFRGRSTDRHEIAIPMGFLAKRGKESEALTLAKDGSGRLYYRIGMTYAPKSLKLAAADYGFTVTRKYEGVDNPGDVVRQADGTWKIKAGTKVRVRLSMVAENRRYHVALVDPLPAGFEAMNPALAVTGAIPQDPKPQGGGNRYWWWDRTWYEHQNMRDERVEAFASLLWDGVHDYTYVARATTPGRFVVPPAKAEEMYAPETFGRSASEVVIVE